MFERLTALFQKKDTSQAPLPEVDAQHALGALLVRVAMADKAYLFEEIEEIDRILAAAYGLNPVQAAKMRADCERIAQGVEDDEEMAQIVRDAVTYDQRRDKVEALWKVVMADGITDEREQAVVELVEDVLGVRREDSEAARAAAVIP